MAVTATTFTQRFPEFSNLESAVITATIAESQRQNDSDLWGDQYDDAVNYMTAHLLASRTQSIGQQIGVSQNARVQKYVGAAGYTLQTRPAGPTALLISICGRG